MHEYINKSVYIYTYCIYTWDERLFTINLSPQKKEKKKKEMKVRLLH